MSFSCSSKHCFHRTTPVHGVQVRTRKLMNSLGMSSDFDPSPRATKRRRTTNSSLAERKETQSLKKEGHRGHEETADEKDSDEQDLIVLAARQDDSLETPSKRMRRLSNGSSTHGDTVTASNDPQTPSKTSRRSINSSSTKVYAGKPQQESAEGNGHDADSQQENSAPTSQVRSSGRQRRAPQRLEDALVEKAQLKRPKVTRVQNGARRNVESTSASPAPRSILTPSKNRRTGPSKSVAFNAEERQIEEQFGFRDIATPAKSTPKPAATRRATPHPRKARAATRIDEDENTDRKEESLAVDGAFQTSEIADSVVDLVIDSSVDVPRSSFKPAAFRRFVEQPVEAASLTHLRSLVLSRLSGQSLSPKTPEHLQAQYSQLHTLLEATISSGESNSILLLGPRGAGKSLLIDLALQNLSSTYNNDFHVVRLSGFLQTDDRIALREIWRQLGHDRNLDEAETEDIGASYADTMASLLSLLSMHNGMTSDGAEDVNITSRSIIFVLDEFDLFTTHPRQTLLYNLFDIAQSKKAPIAVVGCSTRMDVIECLEKRVKSRFSHRWMLVPGCRTMLEWEACVKDALMVDQSEELKVRRTAAQQNWVDQWNFLAKDLLESSTKARHLIKSHFYSTKSLPELFSALSLIVAAIRVEDSNAQSPQQTDSHTDKQILSTPSILLTVLSIPTLHLSLLVASGRLTTIYHLPTPNFNLVYTHYSELIDATRLKQSAAGSLVASGSLRKWSRDLCRGAWEELGAWGLLVAVQGSEEGMGRAGVGGEGEEDTRMWRAEVSLEDLEWVVKKRFNIDGDGRGIGGTGEILSRWCREI